MADRQIGKYKARLDGQEYTQTHGIGYVDTFYPIEKMNIVQVVLGLAAHFRCELHLLDVKNVILEGALEEVHMEIPLGFDTQWKK